MRLPAGMDEDAVLTAIDRVAELLGNKYRMPGYSQEDVEQETRLMAWEAVQSGRYDPTKATLAGFMFTHCRNRWLNRFRRVISRSDPPCAWCHADDFCCDGFPCEAYVRWRRRNDRKKKLAFAMDIADVIDDGEAGMRAESTATADVEIAELMRIVDEELPVELRRDLLQMRAGVHVPKAQRESVVRVVVGILAREGVSLAI